MFYKVIFSAITVLVASVLLSSCAITTAPTEATSGTIGNTSDASTDLTSSTTLKDDEEEEPEVEVEEFVEANFDQLRSDMAVGEGEYLSALAALLAIDDADKGEFYALTRSNFDQLFSSSKTTPEELVANLKVEVAQAKI